MSAADAWHTNQWFVSPWDYDEKVVGQLNFPRNLKIHDVTLRDGEQQAGVIFDRKDKIRIAKKLDEVGVHRIEAGMPAVSDQDEAAIKEISSLGLKAEIFAFSRCLIEDVKRASDCGAKGVVVEIPCSEHIIKHAYGWTVDKAIKLSIEATLCAKELGLYTVFFPIDSTRAEISWFLDTIEQVATEGHMDALGVVDTFGVISPHAVPYLMRRIRQRIPDKPLEPHFHSDFGMGVGNTIIAMAAGGSVAHTTVTGIGERAGNTPMEDLVLALKTMYGVDLGIRTEMFCELSKMVRETARVSIPQNRSIVGPTLFDIESGIIAGWVEQAGDEHILECVPFTPDLVGQEPVRIVLGKNSGMPSVVHWLRKLGIELPKEKQEGLVPLLKAEVYRKNRLLTTEEFRDLVKRTP